MTRARWLVPFLMLLLVAACAENPAEPTQSDGAAIMTEAELATFGQTILSNAESVKCTVGQVHSGSSANFIEYICINQVEAAIHKQHCEGAGATTVYGPYKTSADPNDDRYTVMCIWEKD